MTQAQVPDVASPDPEPPMARLEGASRLRIFTVIGIVVLFAEIAALQYTMVASAARDIAPSFPGVGATSAGWSSSSAWSARRPPPSSARCPTSGANG